MSIKENLNSIAFATCGSGGHVFPAINSAKRIKEKHKNVKIFLIIDKRGCAFLDKKSSLVFDDILILEVNRNRTKLHYCFDLFLSFVRIFSFIRQKNIKSLVSFGSYIGLISVFASFFNFVPSFLYYSDTILNFASKVSVFFNVRFFYNLKETTIPKWFKSKAIRIGYPFSDEINLYLKLKNNNLERDFSHLELSNSIRNELNILILGGSQGSVFLTKLMQDVFSLMDRNLLIRINVYHQCRVEDCRPLKYFYAKNHIKAEVSSFFQNVPSMLSKSHLLVSRAGISVISELSVFGTPSILIPLPTSRNNHQFFNAKVLSDNNGAILVEEKDANPSTISSIIKNILTDFYLISNMHYKAKEVMPRDAEDGIYREISRFF